MSSALRGLSRLFRRTRGKHHRPTRWPRQRRQAALERAEHDMAWLGEILPRTPPAEARQQEPWAPRITRWVRVACPVPDDTMILSPVPAAMVLDLMGHGFVWDPR